MGVDDDEEADDDVGPGSDHSDSPAFVFSNEERRIIHKNLAQYANSRILSFVDDLLRLDSTKRMMS